MRRGVKRDTSLEGTRVGLVCLCAEGQRYPRNHGQYTRQKNVVGEENTCPGVSQATTAHRQTQRVEVKENDEAVS